MSTSRSFKEYVSSRFYNGLFTSVKEYVDENFSSMSLYSNNVSNIDSAELTDIEIKTVGVDDREDMKIAFDVIIEAEIEVSETTRRYDNSDTCYQWFMISCEGDLAKSLDDYKVVSIQTYKQKNKHNKPLSDSLVPYLKKESIEATATDFLKRNYPEALRIPMPLDVAELATRMGLKIEQQHITQDYSVFGQIFFADCDTEVYDADSNMMIEKHIKGGTILVDPEFYHLRNLGSLNNTIVHECVHWDRHRKAFELERLYNNQATQIKCLVVGGIKDTSVRSANDWMEWQANVLAPKIQMPLGSFKVKASEFIRIYRKEMSTFELVDVMEPVIDALSIFFCVSRHAAKIRMIDIGYEDAIGAFTFIDGRYVPPHSFKKGSIEKNQTFSISAVDAMIQSVMQPALQETRKDGTYFYVDSHVCLNSPKYITKDEQGNIAMTNYARLHIDECCLAFTLKAKTTNKYQEEFYKECVLFRDADSGMVFEAHFAADESGSVVEKAKSMTSFGNEIMDMMSKLPRTFPESLNMLIEWSELTMEELAEKALLSDRTIRRMRNEADYNTPIESVVALCIAMRLPPQFSRHLMETSGHIIRYSNPAHVIYESFILGFYNQSIHECNDLLRAQGLKELTGKE